MIEKIGHVRNPLTIIAIFAGIAEVSGTITLPFLKENIQSTYIWFLMGFPSALVAIFFLVLILKREVLYAPSDYRNEETFYRFFQPSDKSLLDKIDEESKDSEINGKEAPSRTLPDEKPQAIIARRDFQAKSLLAEELVISKLSKNLKITFKRNVSPIDNKEFYFDAVAQTSDRIYLVEVKYIRNLSSLRHRINVFYDVCAFYQTLPDPIKPKFEFIFALVIEADELHPLPFSEVDKTIQEIAQKFDYKTRIMLCNFKELVEEKSI